jgi:lysophospholipase L1-like esterase/pimeloyl-ACP methyl ester carboxylesterase
MRNPNHITCPHPHVYHYALLVFVFINWSWGHAHGQSSGVAKQHVIKVACVGASTTYGATIKNRPLNGFPERLQRLLADGWEVRNFGLNSAGVLLKGELPYRGTATWQAALDFQPDIVIFNLGVNDVKPDSWQHKADFIKDYEKLIGDFSSSASHPTFYLCRELPVFKDQWGIRKKIVETELYPLKQKLARKCQLRMIDFYTPFLNHPELFSDGIHVTAKGAALMAKITAQVLEAQVPAAKKLARTAQIPAESKDSFPGRLSYWKGFKRYDFFLDLRNARLVVPAHPRKDHPWVWRARFPDWHTEMDSILLAHGFYVFYLNTDTLLGSPAAIGYWDQAYQYLRSCYQLNSKVALEGVSRGGLYIYGFAKKYPDRVSCIYAEAPVCDIRSWPGGFYSSPGDSAIWARLLRVYHLSPAQAQHYSDNPFDHLAPLAKRKIPIWHSIGLCDSLAPPRENTFILARRYIELGGPVTIYPNTRSATSLHGHHFAIDDPMAGARFIIGSSKRKIFNNNP